MKVLSLFSGGGLGDFGLELAGMEICGQVENDDYCQKILKLRWPDVPKWTDIKNVTGKEIIEKIGTIDFISGGFPCQDISGLGSKLGFKGKHSSLWFEFLRIIQEISPPYILIENVARLKRHGLGTILNELFKSGYDAEWRMLRASEFGHAHERKRLFILAYSTGFSRLQTSEGIMSARKIRKTWTHSCRLPGTTLSSSDWAVYEPYFDRIINGTPNRVERCKLLGNGQVIQVVEWIGKKIMEFDKLNREK